MVTEKKVFIFSVFQREKKRKKNRRDSICLLVSSSEQLYIIAFFPISNNLYPLIIDFVRRKLKFLLFSTFSWKRLEKVERRRYSWRKGKIFRTATAAIFANHECRSCGGSHRAWTSPLKEKRNEREVRARACIYIRVRVYVYNTKRERERISRIKTRWTQYPLFPYRVRSSTVCPAPPIFPPPAPLLEMLLLARDPPLSYTDILRDMRSPPRLSINSYHALDSRSINICLITIIHPPSSRTFSTNFYQ